MKKRLFACSSMLLCCALTTHAQDSFESVMARGNSTSYVVRVTGNNLSDVPVGPAAELAFLNNVTYLQSYIRPSSTLLPLVLNGSVVTIGQRMLVGDATDDGVSPLQIHNGMRIYGSNYRGITVDANAGFTTIDLANNGARRAYMGINTASAYSDYVAFGAVGDDGTERPILIQRSTGNVGIGLDLTVSPNPPKELLTVNGNILAKKITVKQGVWPDYVFENNYALPSLQELEHYITTNKHLPGMPTAQDVQTNGQDVGETNKQLVQKVEELTLYLIAEHKKNETLETQLLEMNKRLEKLEQK